MRLIGSFKKILPFYWPSFLTDLANSQLASFGGQGMFYCVTKGILEISLAPLSIFEAFFENAVCTILYVRYCMYRRRRRKNSATDLCRSFEPCSCGTLVLACRAAVCYKQLRVHTKQKFLG